MNYYLSTYRGRVTKSRVPRNPRRRERRIFSFLKKKNTGLLLAPCWVECYYYYLLTVLVGSDEGTTFAAVVTLYYTRILRIYNNCPAGTPSPRLGCNTLYSIGLHVDITSTESVCSTEHTPACTAPTACVSIVYSVHIIIIFVRRTVCKPKYVVYCIACVVLKALRDGTIHYACTTRPRVGREISCILCTTIFTAQRFRTNTIRT